MFRRTKKHVLGVLLSDGSPKPNGCDVGDRVVMQHKREFWYGKVVALFGKKKHYLLVFLCCATIAWV